MEGKIEGEVLFLPLFSQLKQESVKLQQSCLQLSSQDLSLATEVLSTLRKTFYKNFSNQNLVANTEELRDILVNFLKILIKDLLPCFKSSNLKMQNLPVASFYNALSLCITSFVNMMVGNSDVRKIIWPYIKSFLYDIISLPLTVSHVGAALLHQFLLEREVKEEILKDNLLVPFIPLLLKSYVVEGPHSCFSLFCLEISFEEPNAVSSIWEKLAVKEKLLMLDILTNIIHKQNSSLPLSTIELLKDSYKKDADKVFSFHDNELNLKIATTIIRLTNFLSCAASSDHFRTYLQSDKSLLISSIFLLKAISDIGDSSKIFSSCAQEKRTLMANELDQHPTFGFKSDLIRLIAGLVFCNKDNQNTVRELNGILLVLENSQFDSNNPLVREASIFALRNLLEENYENQKIIFDLEMKGPATNTGLSKLGLEITVDEGKVYLHQT